MTGREPEGILSASDWKSSNSVENMRVSTSGIGGLSLRRAGFAPTDVPQSSCRSNSTVDSKNQHSEVELCLFIDPMENPC